MEVINQGYTYLMQGMIGLVVGGVIGLTLYSLANHKLLIKEKVWDYKITQEGI